jgi:hypothetical protein
MLAQMSEITLVARELIQALAADELPRLHKHPRVEIRAGSRVNPEVFPQITDGAIVSEVSRPGLDWSFHATVWIGRRMLLELSEPTDSN